MKEKLNNYSIGQKKLLIRINNFRNKINYAENKYNQLSKGCYKNKN